MFNRSFLLCLLVSVCFMSLEAQKKKEIKKHGVKTVTSTKTMGAKTLNSEKLTFNLNGLLTEELKYDVAGNVSYQIKYKYNIEEQLIEESKYDAKNLLLEKRKIKYNNGSQKIEERTEDGNGKQIRRTTYKYNAKGLRIEKKTYDKDNTLLITKKTNYKYNK